MSRRILITGGASGIGRVIANSFQSLGDHIAVCDKSLDNIKKLRLEMPKSLIVNADVTQENQMKSFFEEVMDCFGGIDVLISNAGISGPAENIENLEFLDWKSCLDVNLNGAFLTSRWGAKVMKGQGSGLILFVSSTSGLFGVPMRAPYVTAKWGLIGLTKTLAMELGPDGIRVNAICPGSVVGERMSNVCKMESSASGLSEEEIENQYRAGVSLRQFVNSEDVADMAVFLASKAASKITGQALAVDGHTEKMV